MSFFRKLFKNVLRTSYWLHNAQKLCFWIDFWCLGGEQMLLPTGYSDLNVEAYWTCTSCVQKLNSGSSVSPINYIVGCIVDQNLYKNTISEQYGVSRMSREQFLKVFEKMKILIFFSHFFHVFTFCDFFRFGHDTRWWSRRGGPRSTPRYLSL